MRRTTPVLCILSSLSGIAANIATNFRCSSEFLEYCIIWYINLFIIRICQIRINLFCMWILTIFSDVCESKRDEKDTIKYGYESRSESSKRKLLFITDNLKCWVLSFIGFYFYFYGSNFYLKIWILWRNR